MSAPTPGQPFGSVVLHRQHRFRPVNPPTVMRHYARREDYALNQIRRQSVAPDWTERFCWVALAVLAVVSFWLVVSL